MSKYFRPWNIDQTLLLPPNVQDFVPKGHVSRFIVELVRESLDLKEITGTVTSAGQQVILREGEGTDFVSPGTPPTPVKRWAPQRIRTALASVN